VTGRVVLTALGVAVVLLVYLDAFRTVFHSRGRGGPLSRRQNRLVWKLFRRTARWRRPDARDAWLALAAPCMVVLTMAAWGFLLMAGFAMIFRSWLSHFLASPGAVHHSWAEALYLSGYVATTLGMGDLVPDTPVLRLLTVIEAFSGFAVLTLSVTYLLGVYGALMSVNVLAARIHAFFRDGGVRAMDVARTRERDALLRWADPTTDRLLHVLQAHFQYPILHYFRSTDRRYSLVVQLRHLLALHSLVEGAGPREGELARVLDSPSLRALSEVVREYLEEVASLVTVDAGRPERSGRELEQTYRRLLEYMVYPAEEGS
jgi:hypothetical protein